MDALGDRHPNRTAGRRDWRQWIQRRFNWSWFTATQSTGGVAIVLSECPKQFDGLQTASTVLFILNLVLWLTFLALMVIRWFTKPAMFKRSFIDAPECFYYGSAWLSAATIIICIQRFGQPHTGSWLITTIRVLFWIYAAITLLSTVLHFLALSKYTPITAIEMTPAWFFLIYNTMLTGTIAAAIAMDQPPRQRVPIIVAGVAYQGLGMLGSMLILPWLFAHLLQCGWPSADQVPGLFMAVGGIGFTIVALIGNARAIPTGVEYFSYHPDAHEILLVLSTWISIFIWLFGFFFFIIALILTLKTSILRKEGRFHPLSKFNNNFWAFIFPNVGFTLGTIYIGQELGSNAIEWVGAVMVILLFALWLFAMVLMTCAIAISLLLDESYRLL